MCKKIEELVAYQFKNLTGVQADENNILNMNVYPQKRETLKQQLRKALPDLRLRSSDGLVRVSDFAEYIERAETKREGFFQKGLEIARLICEDAGLTLNDDLYAELRPQGEGNAYLSAQCVYFLEASKVYNAWSQELKGDYYPYYPPVSLLEKCRTIREMIDLYYRRGKF